MKHTLTESKDSFDLKALNNFELITQTKAAVQTERYATAQVVRLLQEISDRRLYLKHGYPSLFEMITKEFGYCAGSAMRRINAMRLVRDIPSVEAKIESGEISLSVASEVQSFFYSEAKEARPYSVNAKLELLEVCSGKSKREVELELCKRNPERETRESIRLTSPDRLRVSFSISEELNQKLNRLRDLLSHTDPNMSLENLIDRLAEFGLDKYDPVRKAKRSEANKQKREARAQSSRQSERVFEQSDENAETANSGIGQSQDMNGQSDDKSFGVKSVSDAFMDLAPVKTSLPPAEVNLEVSGNNLNEQRADDVHGTQMSVSPKSRYIRAQDRHDLTLKDDGLGCTYVSPETGRRCGSTRFSEIDHITPFSYGGSNNSENLRPLCSAHNKLAWRERTGSQVRSRRLAYG